MEVQARISSITVRILHIDHFDLESFLGIRGFADERLDADIQETAVVDALICMSHATNRDD